MGSGTSPRQERSRPLERCCPRFLGNAPVVGPPYHSPVRSGFSLIELVCTLTIVGLVLLMTVPRFGEWRDNLAAERAAVQVSTFYRAARYAALLRATAVQIDLTSDTLRATYLGLRDSVFALVEGPAAYGVTLSVSRSTIRLHPSGWGWGAANTKIVLRRGQAAESLTTSRLGRLKRW